MKHLPYIRPNKLIKIKMQSYYFADCTAPFRVSFFTDALSDVAAKTANTLPSKGKCSSFQDLHDNPNPDTHDTIYSTPDNPNPDTRSSINDLHFQYKNLQFTNFMKLLLNIGVGVIYFWFFLISYITKCICEAKYKNNYYN
jgi:hypothetical protein